MSESLLPINATPQERSIELSIRRVGGVEVPLKELWRPEEIPEKLLPWLAWSLSVDFWDPTWSVERKRAVVAGSVDLHRIKGTKAALQKLLEILGLVGTVTEWFQYGGRPYLFRVEIDADASGGVPQALIPQVLWGINEYKNTRSWLDGLGCTSRAEGNIATAGGSVSVGRDRGVYDGMVSHTAQGAMQFAGGAVSTATDYARAEYHGE